VREVNGSEERIESFAFSPKEVKLPTKEISSEKGKTEIGTLREAKETLDTMHHDAIKRILERNNQYISEADQKRISLGADSIEAVEYGSEKGWTGRYLLDEGKSNIEVCVLNREQMERSMIHETHHFASKNQEVFVPDPERKGYTIYQTVGVRQARWFHSDETGENTQITVRGRGMNEGLTTMYTNRQLREMSEKKGMDAERQGIYAHATELCIQLEDMVGEDTLKEAYFGGNHEQLKAKVDELAGEGGYENLRDCMDRTLSNDYWERVQAMAEAQEILTRMFENEGGEL